MLANRDHVAEDVFEAVHVDVLTIGAVIPHLEDGGRIQDDPVGVVLVCQAPGDTEWPRQVGVKSPNLSI